MDKLRDKVNPEKRRKVSVSESEVDDYSKSAYEEGEFEIIEDDLEEPEHEVSEADEAPSESVEQEEKKQIVSV